MKRRASAIALAAVLGAVGVTSAGVTSAVSQSSDQTPVRIGVLEDMTGPLSSIGGPGNVVAAQMAVEDFGGKVLGRKIEIVSGDDQNKPDVLSRRIADIK